MSTPLTLSVSDSEATLVHGPNGTSTPSGAPVFPSKNGLGEGDPVGLEKGSPKEEPSTPSEQALKGWRWFLVLIAIYSSAFLYGLDNTIVADIQSAVLATYGEIEKLSWLGIGFPLGSIATILSIGRAYGVFDVKWLYVSSLTIFAAGSALCGGAPSMDGLIVGRVMAGAGGAGMYLGLLNLISINTTLHERPIYMSITGLVWGVGTILGPVIGGLFADSPATWRWAFYMNLIIFGIFSPVYLFYLPSFQPQPNTPWLKKIKQLDWVGITLNAGVYTTWVLALTFGGSTWAWSDGRTIAMFIVFGITLITYVITQYFPLFTTLEDRLFPGEFLRRRSMILLYVTTACAGTALFVPIYYIPLYFQFVNGDSGLQAAVRLLPFILLFITFVLGNGFAMPRFGYYMPWYVFGGVFMLIGGSLMYTVDSTTSTSAIYGYTILIAVGTGACAQAAYSIAPAKVELRKVPAAIGYINTAQIGAIVIALTISGTIFQNVAYSNLQPVLAGHGFSSADIHAAVAGTKSTIFTTVSPEVRAAAVEAIVQAISKVYALVIAAGALGLVSSVFLRREKLFMEISAGG